MHKVDDDKTMTARKLFELGDSKQTMTKRSKIPDQPPADHESQSISALMGRDDGEVEDKKKDLEKP